jgi:integrase
VLGLLPAASAGRSFIACWTKPWKNQEIGPNPVSARGTRVKLPQRKKARILSADEVSSLVEAARKVSGEGDALAIETMCLLGLRIGEMAGLQARDVDLVAREIVIRRTVSDSGGASFSRMLRRPTSTEFSQWQTASPVEAACGLHPGPGNHWSGAHLPGAGRGGPIRPNN